MSKKVICYNCKKKFENSGDEVVYDGYGHYYCNKCAGEIVDKFNDFVGGDASLTSKGVDVPLGDIVKFLGMMERNGPMFLNIISDIRRHNIIKA